MSRPTTKNIGRRKGSRNQALDPRGRFSIDPAPRSSARCRLTPQGLAALPLGSGPTRSSSIKPGVQPPRHDQNDTARFEPRPNPRSGLRLCASPGDGVRTTVDPFATWIVEPRSAWRFRLHESNSEQDMALNVHPSLLLLSIGGSLRG